jgi:hydrogenase expression/formation protein HypD
MSDEALAAVKVRLKAYDGPRMRIMEVCGSHTAAIVKNGIPGLLSEQIELVAGPGCPVCVTPTDYIDRLIALSREKDTCVVTFGDLLRVPGSSGTLMQAKNAGGRAEMVYSPFDIIAMAQAVPETTFVFAAVGFETTAPVYALLLDQIVEAHIQNIRFLTALKTMPPVIDALCAGGADVQGFIAPGHVAVVTGSDAFKPLAERYQLPFGVAGFSGRHLLYAIDGIVRARGRDTVMNFYPEAVTPGGNVKAQALVAKYFEPGDALWRGIGVIPGSGLFLKSAVQRFDVGSRALQHDHPMNAACRCGEVLKGAIAPQDCPLFKTACTPLHPQGACMVSAEGNCLSVYNQN